MSFAQRIVLASLVFISGSSIAQKHFTVSYIKGKVDMKSRKHWIALKHSDRLSRDNEVRLDRNATLHLIDSAGLPLLFTLPGIYKIGDFFDNSLSATVMTKDGKIVHGRVSRVKQNFFGSDSPIKVLLPTDSTFATVYAKQFVIRWIDESPDSAYQITIKNLLKGPIATFKSNVTELKFDLDDERFTKERVFYVVVTAANNGKRKSAEHVFKRIITHERYRIDDILNKEIILDNSRALDQLILAGFYEEHALFVDAVNAYLESIRLGKDDPAYSEAFTIFLQRYGLELVKQTGR
jgi:hypothetical protein